MRTDSNPMLINKVTNTINHDLDQCIMKLVSKLSKFISLEISKVE